MMSHNSNFRTLQYVNWCKRLFVFIKHLSPEINHKR